MISVLITFLILLSTDDAPRLARAPADYQIIHSDRAGAYFVARPLKERYDRSLGELSTLRRRIDDADIGGEEARREIERLSAVLKALKEQIERSKVYVPGAQVHRATTIESVPMGADEFVLVDASQVEIRGWDRDEIRCEVEKTILSADAQGVAEDLAGIALEHRIVSGREVFAFYQSIAHKPEWKREWDRFAFGEFLDREFHHIRIKGLDHEQGNRQITVSAKNEEGAGEMSSQWRRQARLILYVPACGRIGIRGALAGFKAVGVQAPMTILGQGDRDYQARYEVANHVGAIVTENLTLHSLDHVKGDVRIRSTAHEGNVATRHDDRGITMEPGSSRSADYRDIEGDLSVNLVRTDLDLARISGRIDVVNDFGRTTWTIDQPLARRDHRVVTESGSIDIRLDWASLQGLPMALYTECGIIQLAAGGREDWEPSMFTADAGGNRYRSWNGFLSRKGEVPSGIALFERVGNAWDGRDRGAGVDVLNRAGTIRLLPTGP
ncbi:MAG: hypothetical protein U0800_04330 [Isosphaeraceae bacterium]